MKQPPAPPSHNHRNTRIMGAVPINKFTKSTAYAIIMLSCYFLGYISSPAASTVVSQSNSASRKTRSTPQRQVPISASGTELIDHNRFSTQCGSPVSSKHVRRTIVDRVFNGSNPWQDFPPAHVRKLLRPQRIRGWGSNGAVFENLIREVRPKIIIEVGTFLGASALHMAQLAQKLGLHDTQIVCIDDFRGWPGFQQEKFFKDMKMVNGDVLLMYQFMQNVIQLKASESVVFMPFSTGSALEKLCEWGVFGDLVEVDAGHDFHSAWSDINKAYKILRPGGVIFGHDYFTSTDNKGVRRAVNLFARTNNLKIQVDGQHWLIRSIRSPN